MGYGNSLKELRKNNNMSQENLAEKFKTTQASISFWEKSEYPPLEIIEKYCKFYKIPMPEFFSNDEEEAQKYDLHPKIIRCAKDLTNLDEEDQEEILHAFDLILKTIIRKR